MPNQFAYSKVFFDRWYRPEYTTVIVAGDVTPGRGAAARREVLGRLEGGGRTRWTSRASRRPRGPVYAHVPWTRADAALGDAWRSTAPAFSETSKDSAALDMLSDLTFGPTSDALQEPRRGRAEGRPAGRVLPANTRSRRSSTVLARVKKTEDDAVYVRDEILRTFARDRASCRWRRSASTDAKSNARYSLRAQRSTTPSRSPASLARFVRYRRSYETVNEVYRIYDALTPADLPGGGAEVLHRRRPGRRRRSSKDPLPAGDREARLARDDPGRGVRAGRRRGCRTVPRRRALAELRAARQRSQLPQLNVKLLFTAGSAHDPTGKEGLAALAAAMIADGRVAGA